MNSKQFAWQYLIENGSAGVTSSYYGGYDLVDKRMKYLDTGWDYRPIKVHYLKEIKDLGVDWNKTRAPVSELMSQFRGTFNDSSETEYLVGTLILTNGEKQSWIAESIKITNVFGMMAELGKSKERFKEIFG